MDSKNQTQKRQIKFRAWDKKRKRFGYFLLSQFGIDIPVESYLPLNLHRSDDDEIYRIEYEDIEWLQYTGLHDKNGKEIYEGDIVIKDNGNHKYYDISFEVGGYWLGPCPDDGTLDCHFLGLDVSPMSLEVIGNIYENPELL